MNDVVTFLASFLVFILILYWAGTRPLQKGDLEDDLEDADLTEK